MQQLFVTLIIVLIPFYSSGMHFFITKAKIFNNPQIIKRIHYTQNNGKLLQVVKELNDEVKLLRKEIVELQKTTKRIEETVQEIPQYNNEIKTVIWQELGLPRRKK